MANGKSVVVIDRASSKVPAVEDPSVEFIPYFLGYDDPKDLCKALDGAETVYSVVTPDVQYGSVLDFYKTNQLGMEHLVEACQTAGVSKLVYASSLAVTNHHINSKNQNEEDPLPPVETYITSYDKTKRLGEETVLAANDGKTLYTCSLRIGAILSGPSDYMLRDLLAQGELTGRMITVSMEPIDTISARDVCTAMLKADEKLKTEKALQGQALFVTKCRNNQAPKGPEVPYLLGKLMHWQVYILPPTLLYIIRTAKWLQHQVTSRIYGEQMGMPPHLYLDITKYEQTFDNAKAHKILDFEPQDSWQDALGEIIREYKKQQQAS